MSLIRKDKYINYGLNLTDKQLKKILMSAKNNKPTVVRLKQQHQIDGAGNLREIPLTQTQINKVKNAKNNLNLKFSAAQLKFLKKSGGFLPLLALLPLIFGGLGAVGGISGGIASAVSSANSAKATAAAQAELERHNREVESQLRSTSTGTGFISDRIENIPILGKLAPILRKLGIGLSECEKLKNGNRIHMGQRIYLSTSGNGLYLGKKGKGVFLGKGR